MPKTLKEIHEDVPPNYYDVGIKKNLFQKFWHTNRFTKVKSFSPYPLGRVLDIGCHSGLFTQHITSNSKNVEVYGIDVSAQAIKYAQKRIKNGHFKTADAHNLPFKDNYFDLVFCLEMLEHVENPEKVVQEIKRVVKKGGTGIILIPINSILFRTIWFLWNMLNPVWKHSHIQNFDEKRLVSLVRKNGFKVVGQKKINWGMLLMMRISK